MAFKSCKTILKPDNQEPYRQTSDDGDLFSANEFRHPHSKDSGEPEFRKSGKLLQVLLPSESYGSERI